MLIRFLYDVYFTCLMSSMTNDRFHSHDTYLKCYYTSKVGAFKMITTTSA